MTHRQLAGAAPWRPPFRKTLLSAAGLAFVAGLVAAPAVQAATPEERAQSTLAQMTLSEKLQMLHGGASCGYVGCVDANSRLGIPALHMQDGPAGVGNGNSGVTQLPAPVSAAATWNTEAIKKYGKVLGSEQWGKGANVALAPTVNIVRDPRWGRAFESLGEDPYLAGQMAAAEIQGIQSKGPMAQVKHYVAYNQETNRFDLSDNAILGDRALHEIYTPAFAAAIHQGGVHSAMCSYNLINDVHACEHGPFQNTILKGELGFSGFITADWGATHSTVASANGGLDIEMPDARYFGSALTTAVNNGEVSQATIDDKAYRILLAMYRQGLFDKPNTGRPDAVVTSAAHAKTARQVAIQGSVLLKNSGNVLPFTASTHTVAVIGPGAGSGAMTAGGGSATVAADHIVTPYDGLKKRAGSAVAVTYAPGITRIDGALPPIDSAYLVPKSGSGHGMTADFFANPDLTLPVVLTRQDAMVDFDWHGGSPGSGVGGQNWSGRWTATLTPPVSGTYTFSVTSDDGSRLFVNGQKIIDAWVAQSSNTRTATIALTAGTPVSIQVDYFQLQGGSNLTLGWLLPGQNLHDQAINNARAADTAVVVVNKFEAEGGDLGDLALSAPQAQLIADVAAVNPRTVVVVNSGSAITMPWAGSVSAIVEAWYPGQEYGDALAALLFGDENFSGKLPVTFPKQLADVPAHTPEQFPGKDGKVLYSEGIDVGYRWYDRQNIEPLFAFGHGLSYTSFAYSNLQVAAPDTNGKVAVTFDLKNTGSRAGAEVAQVYVGQPASADEPPRLLRGFERVVLKPGQSKPVTVTLDARSFEHWNAGWVVSAGTNKVMVGSSSRDIRLNGQVAIAAPKALKRTGWTATASTSYLGDVPAKLLDGNATTRWSSGVPMAGGEWVQLDLPSSQRFSRLVMDSGASVTDYAAAYQVFVSNDGIGWGQPVYTGLGSGPVLTASFKTQNASHVRVVQIGSSTGWWSIAELNLLR